LKELKNSPAVVYQAGCVDVPYYAIAFNRNGCVSVFETGKLGCFHAKHSDAVFLRLQTLISGAGGVCKACSESGDKLTTAAVEVQTTSPIRGVVRARRTEQ